MDKLSNLITGGLRFRPRDIWQNVDRVSLISLIAANVFPILLAVVFRWNIGGVVFIYWTENLVIGLFAILRILLAGDSSLQANGPARAFLVPFFMVHYFLFCFVHGVFLVVIFSGLLDASGATGMHMGGSPLTMLSGAFEKFFGGSSVGAILAVGGLVASHGISFVRNYWRGGEYKTTNALFEMFRPYGRIVLLHVSILFGGILVLLLGSSWPLVVLFMLGKTGLDIAVHSAEHSRGEPVNDQIVH